MEETPRGTKELNRLKPNRRRQAEEELKLIKGLAQSISERRAKVQRTEKATNTAIEHFSQYVAHTLYDLDNGARHLAQHKISQVLFQAQTGTLTVDNPYGFMAPTQPQPQFFQPPTLQFSSTCMNNRAVSTHSQFEKHQQFSSPQNE